MIQLTKDKFHELVITSDGILKAKRPCVVLFFLPYCGPCRVLMPILQDVSSDYSDIDFYMINASTEKPIPKEMGIKSAPTVCYIKNIDFTITKGIRTREELKNKIDKLLK